MSINPLLAIDFYKADHRRQYPEGTTEIYSNFTPRFVKRNHNMLSSFDNKVVVFGIQGFILEFLVDYWNEHFFKKNIIDIVREYKSIMTTSLNLIDFDCSHIESLHRLGYLPIEIKAIEEGSRVPVGIPVLTIRNTHPDFFWLTNYLETVISASLWKPITSATTAYEFKRVLKHYAKNTGTREAVFFQAHDFSFRGMSGWQDATVSGAAHLTSFFGTDCVSAISYLSQYYYTGIGSLVGASVPATEHSVMTCTGEDGEFETIKRLITKVYPSGIVSIVVDSYNLWRVLTDYLPRLKDDILARNGKVVIRPDSGDPLEILCGHVFADEEDARLGVINILAETFGCTLNDKGYKVLNPKIGVIYGDAITVERANKILMHMIDMGYSSDNIVFGVGSFSYQYVTRDTFGFAMKATSAVINGERVTIFKDPITSSSKKSAKGLLCVDIENGEYILREDVSEEEEKTGALQTVFKDGHTENLTDLDTIRANLM